MRKHYVRIRLQQTRHLRKLSAAQLFDLYRGTIGQSIEEPVKLNDSISPRRLARPRTSPFHGGNTGSNPVGDANNPNDLLESTLSAEGLKGFDKKKSLPRRLLFPCLLARHENHFDKLCLRCALRRSDSLGVRVCSDLVVRVT